MTMAQDDQTDGEAMAWLARLRSRTVTTAELTEFATWRKISTNALAYRRAEAFWDSTATLADDADIHDALSASLRRGWLRRWWRSPRHRWMTLGALGGLACVLAGIIGVSWSEPLYQTAVGERSIARLDDGTRIQLDTDSLITPRFRADRRDVVLGRGQAFFDVHHDPSRPFVVDAGSVTVTALGTHFDVERLDGRVTVSLLQGSVSVHSAVTGKTVLLQPGQSVIAGQAGLGEPFAGRVALLTSWRTGRLSFRDTPLKDALAAMNRYTDQPIALGDPSIGNEPISGDFATDDPEGFASAITVLFGADAARRPTAAKLN